MIALAPVVASGAIIGVFMVMVWIVIWRVSRTVSAQCVETGIPPVSLGNAMSGGAMIFGSWWAFAALVDFLRP